MSEIGASVAVDLAAHTVKGHQAVSGIEDDEVGNSSAVAPAAA